MKYRFSMNTDLALGIIIIVSIILFSISIIYIITNRGDGEILNLSFKSLLIPVLIVFGIILSDYLQPIKDRKSQLIYSLTDRPFVVTSLVIDPKEYDALFYGSQDIMTFYAKIKENVELSKREDRLELVETFILHLIHRRYNIHWQIDVSGNDNYFGGNSYSIGAKDPRKPKNKISIDLLHKSFPKNHLIQSIQNDLDFFLPKNMKISSAGNDNIRTLQLKDKFLTINFHMSAFAQAALNEYYGKTNDLLKTRLGTEYNRFKGTNFYGTKIEISVTPNRFRRNHPQTLEELEWAQEMIDYLKNSMDWNLILEKVESINRNELIEVLNNAIIKRKNN